MICSECGINQATVTYKHINNGVIDNKNVCRNCYDKQNQTYEYNKAKISTKLNSYKDVPSVKTCDFCGRSLQEIKSTAYVGCEYCYKTFKKELYNIIENYHNVKIGVADE